jgi:CHAT domain-containing protein
VLDNDNPSYSFLLLSANRKKNSDVKAAGRAEGAEDGSIEARELKELTLRAETIVLSACDTARGRIRNGEGVVGLSWATPIAGSLTVVVGHWEVDESRTNELMYDFHKR